MLRKILDLLPAWTLSIVTLLVILWLTLAPKPLGDDPPQLFPGADKVVHAIMFGGFASMLLLDRQRKNGWKKIGWGTGLVCATISALTGILIEFCQASMGLGRGFEIADIIADTTGAYAFVWLYEILQKYWFRFH